MSEQQHTKDVKARLPHKKERLASGDGGACLNRHVAGTPKEQRKNSCSHRWQSYLATTKRCDDYNAPKYDSLIGSKPIKTGQVSGFPPWYVAQLPAPSGNSWDVVGDNFYTKCTIPYWHEAHHAIPNSTFRQAITDVGKDSDSPEIVVRSVREGLLKEKYNLNHHVNMITLPMDGRVSKAIRLPLHRRTAALPSHPQYSRHVQGRLKAIFAPVRKAIKVHEEPDYETLKDQVVALSRELVDEIRAAMDGVKSAISLDQAFKP